MRFFNDRGVVEHGHDLPLIPITDLHKLIRVKENPDLLETIISNETIRDFMVCKVGDVLRHMEGVDPL
jgi:hypothetical protein